MRKLKFSDQTSARRLEFNGKNWHTLAPGLTPCCRCFSHFPRGESPVMRVRSFVGVCFCLGLITILMGCGGGMASSSQPSAVASPSIMAHPASRTVAPGEAATFSATATGTNPLNYQWQRNGTSISGATSASYTTPPVTLADDGAQFQVVVSNSLGSTTSNPATLRVRNVDGIGGRCCDLSQ